MRRPPAIVGQLFSMPVANMNPCMSRSLRVTPPRPFHDSGRAVPLPAGAARLLGEAPAAPPARPEVRRVDLLLPVRRRLRAVRLLPRRRLQGREDDRVALQLLEEVERG